MQSVIYTDIPRGDPDLVREAGTYGVSDLHEALGPTGGRMMLMDGRMRPLDPTLRISGQAVTAFNYPGDNMMMHKALQLAGEGDVLVLTNGGGTQGALWGELAAVYARKKKLGGVVVDGSIRDTDSLAAMKFPAWTTSISAGHSEKRGPGSVNVPVLCAGVQVHPGDVVVADADGVVVIPLRELKATVEIARARKAKEDDMRQKIEAGVTLFDLNNVGAALDATGIEIRSGTWQDSFPR